MSDVRDGLAASSKQFITFTVLVITALVTYHLVVYEGASGISFNSVEITDATLFRRVFLVVPAALLGAFSCVGYLRRCQREVYDYLTISRYRVLGKTGLHELRLPADYILGLFVLRAEGGFLGKVVSSVVTFLCVAVFVFAPAAYIVRSAAENIAVFGAADPVVLVASGTAIALCVCSLLVIVLAGRIRA